jgi:hypothetical protein
MVEFVIILFILIAVILALFPRERVATVTLRPRGVLRTVPMPTRSTRLSEPMKSSFAPANRPKKTRRISFSGEVKQREYNTATGVVGAEKIVPINDASKV